MMAKLAAKMDDSGFVKDAWIHWGEKTYNLKKVSFEIICRIVRLILSHSVTYFKIPRWALPFEQLS